MNLSGGVRCPSGTTGLLYVSVQEDRRGSIVFIVGLKIVLENIYADV